MLPTLFFLLHVSGNANIQTLVKQNRAFLKTVYDLSKNPKLEAQGGETTHQLLALVDPEQK